MKIPYQIAMNLKMNKMKLSKEKYTVAQSIKLMKSHILAKLCKLLIVKLSTSTLEAFLKRYKMS